MDHFTKSLGWFSLECGETKTRVITEAITTEGDNLMSQSELKADICSQRQEWNNAGNQVGFSSTFVWSRKWREIF